MAAQNNCVRHGPSSIFFCHLNAQRVVVVQAVVLMLAQTRDHLLLFTRIYPSSAFPSSSTSAGGLDYALRLMRNRSLKRCAILEINNADDSGEEEPAVSNGDKQQGVRVKGKRHPVYRGVRMRTWGKWVSEIREPKKRSRIWLGTFPAPEMAARAHDAAALTVKGKSAFLNFPHLASSLPRPATLSVRDIQEAAAAAAAAFHMPSKEYHDEDGTLDSTVTKTQVADAETVIPAESWTNEKAAECASNSAWISSFLSENESTIIDNDILFDLPNFLGNMAEALLVSPPWLLGQEGLYGNIYADDHFYAETSLWNYS